MKKLFINLLIFLWVHTILFSAELAPETGTITPTSGSRTESGSIVARVNDEVITVGELNRMMEILKTADRTLILKTLIRERLLTQAATKAHTAVKDNEITEVLNTQMKPYGSQTNFEKTVLEPIKLSFADYKEDIKRQLVREKFIMDKVGSPLPDKSAKVDFFIDTFIAPRDLKSYHQEHQHEFVEPEQIKTRQIILKTNDPLTSSSKKTLAEALLDELQKNADFETLARKYSEVKAESGGLWDWTPKGSFPKEVENVIYTLKEGAISPVIETENNIRIVKVEGKKGSVNNSSLANQDTQDQIRHILISQKLSDGAEKLVDELARNAQIWPLGILSTEEIKASK